MQVPSLKLPAAVLSPCVVALLIVGHASAQAAAKTATVAGANKMNRQLDRALDRALVEASVVGPGTSLKSHPWAAFAAGAWVKIQLHHKMLRDGAKPADWQEQFHLRVGKQSRGEEGGEVTAIRVARLDADGKSQGTAEVTVPAVTALPGIRALGQWPQDLFSIGARREGKVSAKGKERHAENVKTVVVGGKQVEFRGRSFDAKLVTRSWFESNAKGDHKYVMTAWLVEGFDLPVKWSFEMDGKQRAESKVVKLAAAIHIDGNDLPCWLTETVVTIPAGKLTKRRWSSRLVPGFMVKMETRMHTDGIVLEMDEKVTAFQNTAEPDDTSADEEESEGRPALGFMPDYEADAEGALVQRVTEGGAAGIAGLEEGDLIVEIDDESVMSFKDYMEVLGSLVVGQKVLVTIERDGTAKLLRITVGERGQ